MVEPGWSSSTLVPPVKVMALGCGAAEPSPLAPPEMVPLLIMVRSAPITPTPPAPPLPLKAPPVPPPATPPLPPLMLPKLLSVPPPGSSAPMPPAPPLPPVAPRPLPRPPAPPLPPAIVLMLVEVTPLPSRTPPLPPAPPAPPPPKRPALPPLPPLPPLMLPELASVPPPPRRPALPPAPPAPPPPKRPASPPVPPLPPLMLPELASVPAPVSSPPLPPAPPLPPVAPEPLPRPPAPPLPPAIVLHVGVGEAAAVKDAAIAAGAAAAAAAEEAGIAAGAAIAAAQWSETGCRAGGHQAVRAAAPAAGPARRAADIGGVNSGVAVAAGCLRAAPAGDGLKPVDRGATSATGRTGAAAPAATSFSSAGRGPATIAPHRRRGDAAGPAGAACTGAARAAVRQGRAGERDRPHQDDAAEQRAPDARWPALRRRSQSTRMHSPRAPARDTAGQARPCLSPGAAPGQRYGSGGARSIRIRPFAADCSPPVALPPRRPRSPDGAQRNPGFVPHTTAPHGALSARLQRALRRNAGYERPQRNSPRIAQRAGAGVGR